MSKPQKLEKQLAKYILNYRTVNKITQEVIAFNIGISTRHYQQIEAGKISIRLKTLSKILKAIDVGITDIFKEEK